MLLILFVVPYFAQADEILDSSLMSAVGLGDVVKVKALLSEGASPNSKNTANGYSALMASMVHADTTILKMLLDAGADVNVKTTTGETALLYAVMANNSAAVSELVSAGADKDITTSMGISPFSMAMTMRNNQIISLLSVDVAKATEKKEELKNDGDKDSATINNKNIVTEIKYDRFSNRLVVSAVLNIPLPTKHDSLSLNCDRVFDAQALAALLKNKKADVPLSFSLITFGYTKPYHLERKIEYIVDNGAGHSLILLKRETRGRVLAGVYTVISSGFCFFDKGKPIYQGILENKQIEMRINFDNTSPLVFMLSEEAKAAFRDVINFDAKTYLEENQGK